MAGSLLSQFVCREDFNKLCQQPHKLVGNGVGELQASHRAMIPLEPD
jgi:hypothetical protein